MTLSFKARDVHFWVADTFAMGPPHWPVSRVELRGLRLRQVSDAIKIYVTQVYCDHMKGAAPEAYETLKKNWAGLHLMLPTAFMRIEDWERTEEIADLKERSTARVLIGAQYLASDAQTEEEKEFFNDETFESFTRYLERLPRDYSYIFPHALGHLSVRFIYVDDSITVRTELQ